MDDILPQDYAAWRHCIEIDCGIKLTPQWIEQRIAALQDPKDYHTTRFRELWGPAHLDRVLGWFRQALTELS